MQGEHPLPPPVIEKFAKTGGVLSQNVFLLRESVHRAYCRLLKHEVHRQVRGVKHGARHSYRLLGRCVRLQFIYGV